VTVFIRRKEAQDELRKKLLQHKEIDAKVRNLRDQAKELKVEYDKTEDDLKALQSVGQIIGEVLRQLDEERCEAFHLARLCAVHAALCLPPVEPMSL
jgi:ATP-dependent 26S proteasome regulatory subunit